MDMKRINEAMKKAHAALAECEAFDATNAHMIIARALGFDWDTAKTLFGLMRIMGWIEENRDDLGRPFRAAGKPQKG